MPSQTVVFNSTDVLTINEAVRLAAIINACKRNAKVTWLHLAPHHDDLGHGTLRSICDEGGAAYPADEDVRDAHVWITTTTGLEWFPTLKSILDQYEQGVFALDF